MPTVQVPFTPTLEQHLRATTQLPERAVLIRRLQILAVVILLCGLFVLLLSPIDFQTMPPRDYVLGVGFWLGFPASLLLLVPLSLRRQVRRQWNASPALRSPRSYSFDAEGYSFQTELQSSRVLWDAILKVATTRDFLWIYPSRAMGILIPLEAIAPADRETLTAILRQRFPTFEGLPTEFSCDSHDSTR